MRLPKLTKGLLAVLAFAAIIACPGGRILAEGTVSPQSSALCAVGSVPEAMQAPAGQGSLGTESMFEGSPSTVAPSAALMEYGVSWIDHAWKTLNLSMPFVDPPVVVAGPPTSHGLSPGVVRIRNVTDTSFEIRFQEWDYLDGWHCPEPVAWMAIEQGIHPYGGDNVIVVDTFTTNKTNPYSPRWVEFPSAFSQPPVVLAQIQTFNGPDAVTDRICAVYPGGMHICMQEQEASGGHCYEEIGYVAIKKDSNVLRTSDVVTHKPFILAGSLGQAVVRICEEQSADPEMEHFAAEQVGYWTIPVPGLPIIADIQTCHGADPCSLRSTRLAQAFQSETDIAGVTHQWVTINLILTYFDPVVIVSPATYQGHDPGEVRIRNVTHTSFQVRFQEWDYLDGVHCTEGVQWLVAERGIWQAAPEMFIADEFPTNNANVFSPSHVPFPWPFDFMQGVYATQQTANGPSAVTERLSNVQLNGFRVALQEEEAADAVHAEEVLGYVARGTGSGGLPTTGSLGFTSSSSDASATAIAVCHIVEEQSFDAETTHGYEEIAQWASSYLAEMQTCNGTDPCSLRWEITSAPAPSGAPRGTQQLGLRAAACCSLMVRVQDDSDAELTGVEAWLAGSDPDAGALLKLPALSVHEPDEVVTISAPQSVADGRDVLVFSHWEVNGQPWLTGLQTVEVVMTGSRQAAAI